MPRLRLAFFFLCISAISWLASASATSKEEPIPLNKPNPLLKLSSERLCDMACFLFRLSDSSLPVVEIIFKGIPS